MALRVLLADESSTIKRVMQLALQDFAVEVKAVHAGVDVLEVARTFKPDIVFADVLLQKKNGYEVAKDLKNDPELKIIPVVLMWSSFMELDQAAYQRGQANAKLEKPFDVETLRRIVKDNVPRLKNDALSGYLKFPTNISSPLSDEENQKKASAATKRTEAIIPPPPPSRIETVTTPIHQQPPPPPKDELPPEFEDEEIGAGFELADLSATRAPDVPPPHPIESEGEEEWSKADISKFTLDLSPIRLGGEDASISFDMQHGSLDGEKHMEPQLETSAQDTTESRQSSPTLSNDPTYSNYRLRAPPLERTKGEDIPFPDFEKYQATNAHLPVIPEIDFEQSPLQLEKQLSADQLEQILRAQSKEVIEQVVRKVVPEIATQIIREEIKRLLAEGSNDS